MQRVVLGSGAGPCHVVIAMGMTVIKCIVRFRLWSRITHKDMVFDLARMPKLDDLGSGKEIGHYLRRLRPDCIHHAMPQMGPQVSQNWPLARLGANA